MSLIFHIVNTVCFILLPAFEGSNAHNVWNILESMRLFHDIVLSYLFHIKPFKIDSELTNGKLFVLEAWDAHAHIRN